MPRFSSFRARTLALLAALVVIGVLAGASLVGAASAPPTTMSFTLISQDSEATVAPADFFAKPTLAGSGIEDAPVYRDGKKVGDAQTVVTVTRVGDDVTGIIECSVELPEGNIFFDGSMHLAAMGKGVQVPVVGGTSDYAGATGVVTMTASADGSSTTLAFEIMKPGM